MKAILLNFERKEHCKAFFRLIAIGVKSEDLVEIGGRSELLVEVCNFVLEEGKVGVGQLEEHFVDAFSSLNQLLP